MTLTNLFGILEYDGSSIDKCISNTFIGISQSFIRYSLQLLNLPIEKLSSNDLHRLYDYIKSIVCSIDNGTLTIIHDNIDFYVTLNTLKRADKSVHPYTLIHLLMIGIMKKKTKKI